MHALYRNIEAAPAARQFCCGTQQRTPRMLLVRGRRSAAKRAPPQRHVASRIVRKAIIIQTVDHLKWPKRVANTLLYLVTPTT